MDPPRAERVADDMHGDPCRPQRFGIAAFGHAPDGGHDPLRRELASVLEDDAAAVEPNDAAAGEHLDALRLEALEVRDAIRDHIAAHQLLFSLDERHARSGVGEAERRLCADGAAADDDDARDGAVERGCVDGRMLRRAPDRERPRPRARRDDDGVVSALANRGRRRRFHADLDPQALDLPCEVVEIRPQVALELGRRCLVQHAAELAPLVERDLVPAQDEHPCCLEPRRPAADHRDPPRRRRGRDLQLLLVADGRVHGARRALVAHERTAEAAVVAADARPDLAGAAGLRLRRPERVREQRPPERDEVRLARGEDLLRKVGQRDRSRRDHRDSDRALDRLRRPDVNSPRHQHRADLEGHRVVVAAADVDRVDAEALHQAGDLDRLLDRDPVGLVIGAVETNGDGKGFGHLRAHALDHLREEAHAVLERPAVLVRALVRVRREEVRDQVPVRTVELDKVEPREHRAPRCVTELRDRRLDLLARQLLGDEPDRLVHRGPRNGRRRLDGWNPEEALATAVLELETRTRALVPDRLREPREARDELIVREEQLAVEGLPDRRVDMCGGDDHECRSSLRQPPVVPDRALRDGAVAVAVPEALRRLDDTVFELQGADPPGLEEVRVSSHLAWSRRAHQDMVISRLGTGRCTWKRQ